MPVVIKRYHNRKLYNTQSKRYITLDEIESLIKQQEDVQVIENDTGNDITAATLSQIIYEIEKTQAGVLPIDLLQSLVRSGGKKFDEIRRSIFTPLNFSHHFDDELQRRINILVTRGEISQVEGEKLLNQLLPLVPQQENLLDSMEERISGFLKDQQIPTRNDLQTLMGKLDELSQIVERINSTNKTEGGEEASNQIIE